jgi:hypothetical protein
LNTEVFQQLEYVLVVKVLDVPGHTGTSFLIYEKPSTPVAVFLQRIALKLQVPADDLQLACLDYSEKWWSTKSFNADREELWFAGKTAFNLHGVPFEFTVRMSQETRAAESTTERPAKRAKKQTRTQKAAREMMLQFG